MGNMRRWLTGAVALIGLVTSVPNGEAGWFGDSTYEECMLREMKGQNPSMYSMVDKVCSRKFKKEIYVPRNEVKYGFSVDEQKVSTIEITNSGEYNVTRMKVRFAGKKCPDVQENDWGEIREVSIANGRGTLALSGKEVSDGGVVRGLGFFGDACMQTTEIHGTYR